MRKGRQEHPMFYRVRPPVAPTAVSHSLAVITRRAHHLFQAVPLCPLTPCLPLAAPLGQPGGPADQLPAAPDHAQVGGLQEEAAAAVPWRLQGGVEHAGGHAVHGAQGVPVIRVLQAYHLGPGRAGRAGGAGRVGRAGGPGRAGGVGRGWVAWMGCRCGRPVLDVAPAAAGQGCRPGLAGPWKPRQAQPLPPLSWLQDAVVSVAEGSLTALPASGPHLPL
ncbi:hypothetical protein HaLaN_22599 [Haematococcus lacustris]|uniref:Uncharacterized protein n=1 Tax=Haematococcus lacustris TaxID=44745 RepID=A0A6A0A090_HAELA|nr:hypothetical protein HaLaN_22599 [Haematococcus lacustris]